MTCRRIAKESTFGNGRKSDDGVAAVSYEGASRAVPAPDNKVWRELGEVIPPHPTQGGRDTDPSKGLPLFLGNASFETSKSSSCQWHYQLTHVKLEPNCVFGQHLGSFCLPGPNKKVPRLSGNYGTIFDLCNNFGTYTQ